MTYGSLFSGIGGIDLGLERAGMKPVWQVEADDYARTILRKHWPDVAKWSDVRGVGAHNLEAVDLICGGFPCQDVSLAGKGAGLEGERSGLWRQFARIIEELQPAWVLIENVPALRARGLRTVLGDLHARGFDAEWDGLSASAFGAPHRRDRLFVVAYSNRDRIRLESERHQRQGRRVRATVSRNAVSLDHGREGPLADADGSRELQPQGSVCEFGRRVGDRGEKLADTERNRLEGLIFGRAASRAALLALPGWPAEPDVGRVAHGVPARVDRLRGLGNAVVPAVAEYVGRLIMEAAR